MGPKRPGDGLAAGRARKRQRMQAARTIDRPNQGPGSAATAGMPSSIDVDKLLKARAHEINALEKSMKASEAVASQRAFQTVPRHLRRRAASHDARRLPLRLRERARKEIEDGVKKPKKRKLRNLSAHKRRQVMLVGRSKVLERRRGLSLKALGRSLVIHQCGACTVAKNWLETHIWHAKRMHMSDQWNHRIAMAPTEKSFRPSQRAASSGALVQDMSYTIFYEVAWIWSALRQTFDRVCDAGAVSPLSTRFSTGTRVCQTHLFEVSSYPHKLIGPATFLWKPTSPEDPEELRTVLIAVHPSVATETSNNLRQALEKTASTLHKSNIPFRFLQRKLCCFEIAGRRAGQVLGRVLHPAEQLRDVKAEVWPRFLAMSPDAFPDHTIFGLTCEDPRLSFPPRSPAAPLTGSRNTGVFPHIESASCPPFWDAIATGTPIQLQYTDAQLHHRRTENLCPGTRLQPQTSDDRLPVVVFRTNPVAWTLLAPSGWGMALWHSLIYAGPRIGAQQSLRQKFLEDGLASFPYDYPGTAAYQREALADATKREKEYRARPRTKQVNYSKLDTASPFCSVWPPEAYIVLQHRIGADAYGEEITEEDKQALVQVIVRPLSRGRPEALAQLFELPISVSIDDVEGQDLPRVCKESGPVGHVTTGGYSLKRGKGHGIGAIRLDALKRSWNDSRTKVHMAEGQRGVKVLFKNVSGKQCHLARLELVKN